MQEFDLEYRTLVNRIKLENCYPGLGEGVPGSGVRGAGCGVGGGSSTTTTDDSYMTPKRPNTRAGPKNFRVFFRVIFETEKKRIGLIRT